MPFGWVDFPPSVNRLIGLWWLAKILYPEQFPEDIGALSRTCAERPYTMISGGERQLVLLARALAQEPQFVVLDEPTASLDFGNQGKVMRRDPARWPTSGHGVLFTTHDPNHALRAADRAYLLRDGERVAEGDVGEVLNRAQLEELYGAPVETITDTAGRIAFLPG